MTRPSEKRINVSKVNRAPRGLQSLLANVNQGVNPHELDHRISPGVDLFPFWGIEQTQHTFFQGTFGGLPDSKLIRVPEGEIWIPIALSGQVTLAGIGESIIFSLGIADESGQRYVHLVESADRVATTALEYVAAGYQWSSIEPLSADNYLFGQVNRFASAAARSFTMNLKFIRLKG